VRTGGCFQPYRNERRRITPSSVSDLRAPNFCACGEPVKRRVVDGSEEASHDGSLLTGQLQIDYNPLSPRCDLEGKRI
jgi:hypothetical protein